MNTGTGTDAAAPSWTIDDEVIRLRVQGTNRLYPLPQVQSGAAAELLIGTSQDCHLRLEDPKQMVSRRHAQLIRIDAHWSLIDLKSKNGLRAGGLKQPVVRLDPGLEVGIGGLTLVAESTRSIELATFLARLLGWSDAGRSAVDVALRELRTAQTQRTPVVLRGDEDLVDLARELHNRVHGTARPFVTCDPKRQDNEIGDARCGPNFTSGTAAFSAAIGGTLCIVAARPPADYAGILRALWESGGTQTQVMICDDGTHRQGMLLHGTIDVPPLRERSDELTHIVREYGLDAAREFGLPMRTYPEDTAWILAHSSSSYAEISRGARRLAALRAAGTIVGAAERIGIAPVSLRRWIGRRAIPGFGESDEPGC
jgi:hypothetical protein